MIAIAGADDGETIRLKQRRQWTVVGQSILRGYPFLPLRL
jgi:hypothetical protein